MADRAQKSWPELEPEAVTATATETASIPKGLAVCS